MACVLSCHFFKVPLLQCFIGRKRFLVTSYVTLQLCSLCVSSVWCPGGWGLWRCSEKWRTCRFALRAAPARPAAHTAGRLCARNEKKEKKRHTYTHIYTHPFIFFFPSSYLLSSMCCCHISALCSKCVCVCCALVFYLQVVVMPGATDPANMTLPQQPFHPCIFQKYSISFSRLSFFLIKYSVFFLKSHKKKSVFFLFCFFFSFLRLSFYARCPLKRIRF